MTEEEVKELAALRLKASQAQQKVEALSQENRSLRLSHQAYERLQRSNGELALEVRELREQVAFMQRKTVAETRPSEYLERTIVALKGFLDVRRHQVNDLYLQLADLQLQVQELTRSALASMPEEPPDE